MRNVPTFASVLGANVRRVREEHGLTQDQLARLLRRSGLDFSRSAIAALERGSGRGLDLGEVALLCLALETNLEHLLAGGGHVRVSESATIALGKIAPVLRGDGAALSDKDIDTPMMREAAATDLRGAVATVRARRGSLSASQAVAAERAARSDAELAAARRLGVGADDLSFAAFGLWGDSLTSERDRRVVAAIPEGASPRSVQALRGHVTRQLLAELEPIVKGA
ncbi:MAG: helix-turn-helix transcriptional regulator [Acidimicrobiales bacterium]|jgi:transcriptional regulator with XRE-family HTH domain